MIKNNPIIRSTLIIFMFIYACCGIYMLLMGVTIKDLVSGLINTSILMIAYIGLGFSITLVVIASGKNYLLTRKLRTNSNGRYGTTTGFLPSGLDIRKSSISLANDLPIDLQNWIKSIELSHFAVAELFIQLAGVLKNNIELLAVVNENVSLYAHSMAVASKLLEFNSKGSDYCNQIMIEHGYVTPGNYKVKYVEQLIEQQALPLIGIMHDLGKVLSLGEIDGETVYLPNYSERTKLIVNQMDAFWKLPEDLIDALLFASANFLNLSQCPKIIYDHKLAAKYIKGELLIQLLMCAHNDVASYEQLTYEPIQLRTSSIIKDDGADEAYDAEKDTSDPKIALVVAKPKSRTKVKAPIEQPVTNEIPAQKIVTKPMKSSNNKENQNLSTTTDEPINQKKLSEAFKPQKPPLVNTGKLKDTIPEEIPLNKVFGKKL